MKTYRAGKIARYDAFGTGCKMRLRVLEVIEPGHGRSATAGNIRAKVITAIPGWVKGEILTLSACQCVPVGHVINTRYGVTINTDYEWVSE